MSWYHNMTVRQRWELIVLLVVVFGYSAFTIPALLHARAGVRDDLRRTDIATLKRALEQYNNQAKSYPTPPSGSANCTGSADKNSWFFGPASPLLKNKLVAAIPHDVRESTTQQYRYCVTKTDQGQATSFFLEARLEIPQAPMAAFDEDESRKYFARVLNEQGQTLYRVCGGNETQCGSNSDK